MVVVTGDRYLESLVKFVDNQAGPLIDGTLVLKLNPVGLHYVQSRLEALAELEALLVGAPVDYLRAYISDLGDHRALEHLRRILRLLTSLKVVSVLPHPARDPTPLSLLAFIRLKVLELRGCDLSTNAARGLLELRHTLEKIVCHNSTDALRHVFASRIAEIRDSPQWNRLSFVSCACNGLVLMDESLQLLPVVETLDLSRNKFAKVDNLRKCTRLRHLDLGFNQLRSVQSFNEVSCQIVKLVLRNNALTTLCGIDNLKSLEGLDLSYNVISNFSELEILASLPSLLSLWLEGNPLCCAQWYRAQVFSIFPYPEKLLLDERKICTGEIWKRQIIIASRQKRPASFGFYSPAKGDAELEGTINTKRKKHSRLASIESEGQSRYVGSDQESVSCENETQSRDENIASEEEAEIVGLMNRIELRKQEHSALWLQGFDEWLNRDSEKLIESSKCDVGTLNPDKEHYRKHRTRHRYLGESSQYVSDSVQASGDQSRMNFLESGSSFAAISTGFNAYQYYEQTSKVEFKFSMGHTSSKPEPVTGRMDTKQEQMKSYPGKGFFFMRAGNSHLDPSGTPPGYAGSPPHYQEDILHRRHNLEEEFLQLSAESYSAASSDSNTSCSEDDSTEFGSFIPKGDQSLIDELSETSSHSSMCQPEDRHHDKDPGASQVAQNGLYLSDPCVELSMGALKLVESDYLPQLWDKNFPTIENDNGTRHRVNQEAEKKCHKKKPKRRTVLLSEEYSVLEPPLKSGICTDTMEDAGPRYILHGSAQKTIDNKQTWGAATSFTHNRTGVLSGLQYSGADDIIEDYFNSSLADIGVHETCRMCMHCNCIIEQKSGYREGEVAVVLSSENKLYLLLIDTKTDGSGITLSQMGCHRTEDVREVLIGLGLQMLRLCIEEGITYLFTTRSIDISRELLYILHFSDSDTRMQNCSMQSLEQVQVEFFERHICGSSKMNMFQYSMVFFWCKNMKDDLWVSRSLFVLEEHLLVCIEDLRQFGFFSDHSSSPYFSLDSCCSITDVSEMVINTGEGWCLTLALERVSSEFCPSQKARRAKENTSRTKKNPALGPSPWKIRWFSESSLLNFVALVKAIHSGLADSASSLVVRYDS
ncbi:uncharacterized protein LOC127794555 isoform X2 [Diospyros lotus]|uniref:uncharacterized protein LOC127794555 isoform X2 n=1 Tax=Diospyros lotus TaxID=55363 RepID=UPI00224D6883|nr:uncharacterized protein LOC127794555 isoform X2 [Diospyros lotus]